MKDHEMSRLFSIKRDLQAMMDEYICNSDGDPIAIPEHEIKIWNPLKRIIDDARKMLGE